MRTVGLVEQQPKKVAAAKKPTAKAASKATPKAAAKPKSE